jgi:hypothetical protein
MSDDIFHYMYPYMHVMILDENKRECIPKNEGQGAGCCLLPLTESGELHSNYLVEYKTDSILNIATAYRIGPTSFEVQLGSHKLTFGAIDSNVYSYVGTARHSDADFDFGLVEVGFAQSLADLFAKEHIVVVGCEPEMHYHYPTPRLDFENSDSIFITGGIGDIFALDSFFSDAFRSKLKTVYYATKQHSIIHNLISAVYDVEHVIVWDDWRNFSNFKYKQDCLDLIPNPSEGLLQSLDCSIFNVFPQITAGNLTYNNSSWLKEANSADDYVVICPYASGSFRNADGSPCEVTRNFDDADWASVLSFLEDKQVQGYVLNDKKESIPTHSSLVDLSGQTSMLESIELLKNCNRFMGADSSMSVLASKLLPVDRMLVKVVLLHGIRWKRVYWAPQQNFSFLKSRIDTKYLS